MAARLAPASFGLYRMTILLLLHGSNGSRRLPGCPLGRTVRWCIRTLRHPACRHLEAGYNRPTPAVLIAGRDSWGTSELSSNVCPMTDAAPKRPAHPLDAFPDQTWRAWRDHVLTVDIEAVHAAVIAERLDRLLNASREQGISLRDVATRAGISRSVLSTMVRCQVYVTEGKLARLEHAFGIDLNPKFEVSAVKVAALEARCDELRARCRDLETRLVAINSESRDDSYAAVTETPLHRELVAAAS